MPNSLDKYAFFEHIKSLKNFDALVDIIYDLETRISEFEDEPIILKPFQDVLKKIKELKGDDGKDGIRGEKGDEGERGERGRDGKDGKNGKDGKQGRDGIDGKDGVKGEQGLNGADGSPDTPEMIVAKLESLEDEDKLKIEAIKDLQKELDELKKQIKFRPFQQPIYVGGGGVGEGGKVVRSYDLSSKLNGSTKTFTIPAFWRVISVSLSSLTPLRETVDYTTNAATMEITFTSEIDAATKLATGQSCEIIYSEA